MKTVILEGLKTILLLVTFTTVHYYELPNNVLNDYY